MGLNETVIAISLSFVITAGTAFSFATYARNSKRLSENGKAAQSTLVCDGKIREEISKITLPYHLSSQKEAEKKALLLKEKFSNEYGIEIISVGCLKDSAGITQGLDVAWKTDGTEYRTKELFSSVSILK
ncbi:MAG: hypothetical protein J6I53_11480 [Treponema sp.]|nr:hypothetical protein [Treponema sp.]